jgi:DNA-binding NarL/FixJ family response regulator
MPEPRFMAEELDHIRQAIEDGHSLRAIARQLDRDPKAVSNHAKRLGLKSRHRFPNRITGPHSRTIHAQP